MKKIVALVMVVCILCSLSVNVVAAEQKFTINNVTVSASSGKSIWNCAYYASEILEKIWNNYNGKSVTTTTFNSNYNMLKNKSAKEREITSAHVKSFIQNAPLGSRIRICASSDTTTNNYDNCRYGHTMVLVAKDNKAGKFTTLEAGWGGCDAITYTYSSFANKWRGYNGGYKYLFYIADLSCFGSNSTPPKPSYNQNVATTITFSSMSGPGTVTQGNGSHLYGTVKSTGNKIKTIKAEVINSTGKKVLSSSVTVNAYSYSIYNSSLDWAMSFGKLSAGKYTLKYTATTTNGTTKTYSSQFSVTNTASVSYSGMSGPGTIRQGNGSHIKGTVKSTGSKIKTLSAVVTNSSGKKVLNSSVNVNAYSYSIYDSKLDWAMSFGKLPAGKYTLKYTATTVSGISKSYSSTFTVKAK